MITCFQLETNVLNPLQQTLSSVFPRESVPATVADAVADRSSRAEGRVGWPCSPLAVSQHGDVSQECLVASVSHSTKAVGQCLRLPGGKCRTGKDIFIQCLVNLRNLVLLDVFGSKSN